MSAADDRDWSDRVAAALREAGSPWADSAPQWMTDQGLAHRHLRLPGTGVIARVPKQSQMQWPAAENLAYQAACFQRASVSGHAPRLHGLLPPSAHLPRGALLVEDIVGRPARLPADLPALMLALARIHALALPQPANRPPLLEPRDPLAALMAEVDAQAVHLADPRIPAESRLRIRSVMERVRTGGLDRAAVACRLIAFDAHPGNFLVRDNGEAVLVDLEKCRYSLPALDIAHATLYTSTTWDLASRAELTAAEVAQAYRLWSMTLGPAASGSASNWLTLRATMWLWSVTWCAKWLAASGRPAASDTAGEDWSAEHSSVALIAQVRDRVHHYLSPATVHQVIDGFDTLARLLAH